MFKRSYSILLLFFLITAFPFQHVGASSDFDYNEDGVIRCAVLCAPGEDSALDVPRICSDLEQMIKNSDPGIPVRVSFEKITQTKTIMGWWYHPDSKNQRLALTTASYDFVFLAEAEPIVSKFTEIFFEGVQISVNRFAGHHTQLMLLMLESSGSSIEKAEGISRFTKMTYRVADGCGIKVVPAALAWHDVLYHHILPGNSLLSKRAKSFLAAASIWCRITGERVPKDSLTTDWIVKKSAAKLAQSARDAVDAGLHSKHYSGPYKGVVSMGSRMHRRYMIYHAGSAFNPSLKNALGYVIDSAGQSALQYSVTDWHNSGFDRHTVPLDLVCGSVQEMEPLLDLHKYTSTEYMSPNLPAPVNVVYSRNPANDKDGSLTLRNIENLLMDGYKFARKNSCVFVPYQAAWARLRSINPDYVKSAPGKRSNDWLNFMLANMIYSALTGRCQIPSEHEKPHYYNEDHPIGLHSVAARTGWRCLQQQSALKMNRNTLITASPRYYVDKLNPGFVRIRLLDPPSEPVHVLCAPGVPGTLELSKRELLFNSDNYNIEQSVRCSVAGDKPNTFGNLMISALSDDANIDGASAIHPFLLNPDAQKHAGLNFSKSDLSLSDQSYVMLQPDVQPVDFVHVQIFQNGVETADLCFSPFYYGAHPVCLFPDTVAVASGKCELLLKVSSKDKRFDGYEKRFVFRLSCGNLKIPDVKVLSPKSDVEIKGPAFVTAEAEVEGVAGPYEISLFCGRKRLGIEKGVSVKAGVEMGPPLSRLTDGVYPLWAAVRLGNGVVVSSPVNSFTVKTVTD